MSFGKSFIVSLVALVVLNAVIMAITYAIGYGIDDFITAITTSIVYIFYVLFSSTAIAIWVLVPRFTYAIESVPFNWAYFIFNLGLIIAPFIAAVITGRLSEKRVQAFSGFFLSTIISMLISIIVLYQSFSFQMMIGGAVSQTEALMNIILGSLVNGLIYGMIAYLTTKK